MQTNKQCWVCKEAKALEEYWRCQRNEDGRDNVCRDCKQVERDVYFRTPRGLYEQRARLVTNILKQRWRIEYDPTTHQLDHRFSIRAGWRLGIPLDVLCCRYNLEVITTRQNRIKGDKCSISIFDLKHNHKSDPAITKVVMLVSRISEPEQFRRLAKRLNERKVNDEECK